MSENEQIVRFKRMIKALAIIIIERYGEPPEFTRASGLAECDLCGLTYYDHPRVIGLTLVCDGRFFKV